MSYVDELCGVLLFPLFLPPIVLAMVQISNSKCTLSSPCWTGYQLTIAEIGWSPPMTLDKWLRKWMDGRTLII